MCVKAGTMLSDVLNVWGALLLKYLPCKQEEMLSVSSWKCFACFDLWMCAKDRNTAVNFFMFWGLYFWKFCFENRRKCCPFFLENFRGIRLVDIRETYREKCCGNLSRNLLSDSVCETFSRKRGNLSPFFSKKLSGDSTCEFVLKTARNTPDFWKYMLQTEDFLKNFRGIRLVEFCETISRSFSSDSTCEMFVSFEEMLSVLFEKVFGCFDFWVCVKRKFSGARLRTFLLFKQGGNAVQFF